MNNKKYTDNFKKIVFEKLSQISQNSPEFKKSFEKENKNIDECINYILAEVQKSGIQGFTDDEVFGMAMHYYDEDDITCPGAIQCRVIVNHHIELTEEEKKQQKEKALQDLYSEEKAKLKRKPSASQSNKNTNPQISLFQ